jgi:very-short-patch-repair endonuclease
MERTFVEWLEENGISKGIYGYWDQVHFKHTPEGKTKNGWADFVFVSRRLIIELDGTHHKKRTHLDAVRDAHLSDCRGYKVIRITHTEYVKKMRLKEIEQALGI